MSNNSGMERNVTLAAVAVVTLLVLSLTMPIKGVQAATGPVKTESKGSDWRLYAGEARITSGEMPAVTVYTTEEEDAEVVSELGRLVQVEMTADEASIPAPVMEPAASNTDEPPIMIDMDQIVELERVQKRMQQAEADNTYNYCAGVARLF